MNVGTQSTLNDLKKVDERLSTVLSDVEEIKSGATVAGPYRLGIASYYGGGADPIYIHIKTRFKPHVDNIRFHIRYVGYQYNNGETFSGMFAGYCYSGGFTSGGAKGDFLPNVPAIYITSDGFVAMRLYLASNLESSLHIDSIATKGFEAISANNIELIESTEEAL